MSDAILVDAIERAEQGLVDADLGGHLIKQRVARSGQGRSGGFRTIIVYRKGDRAVFLFGFAKNEKTNLSPVEEAGYKSAVKNYLSLTDSKLDDLAADGTLTELDANA